MLFFHQEISYANTMPRYARLCYCLLDEQRGGAGETSRCLFAVRYAPSDMICYR